MSGPKKRTGKPTGGRPGRAGEGVRAAFRVRCQGGAGPFLRWPQGRIAQGCIAQGRRRGRPVEGRWPQAWCARRLGSGPLDPGPLDPARSGPAPSLAPVPVVAREVLVARPEHRRCAAPTVGSTAPRWRAVAVRELLLAGNRKVKEILLAEQMDPAEILEDIVDLAHDLKVPVREISKRRLDAESRTEASQGVVAHAEPLREHSLADLATSVPGSPTPFLVAVDGVTDPGNLGAIIRTAECAG
ncbi:MAG: RNA methyltransferase substrate-binding domain-containing protein [Microthrixaceae bacterium]